MTEFAEEPRWEYDERVGKDVRPVRFVHHRGTSYDMTEEDWYERLVDIEFDKRGLYLRSDGRVAAGQWLPETEEEIQLRLERIEPVTRKQARKEGWEG